MKSTRSALSASLLCLVLLLAACGDSDPEQANPASEFCLEQGGEIEIVEEGGGEVGYCVLPDGTRVDEWEYFRENSPDAS